MPRSATASLRPVLAAVLVPLVLGACNDDPLAPAFPEDVEFAPGLGIDLDQMERLSNGVYYEILEEGDPDGLPVSSGDVVVDYALWLPDGRLLQTTFDDDSAEFPFTLGTNGVIPGFESGMLGGGGMKVGELRRVIIPSELGYGETGSGAIPPQSVLIFEIELLSASSAEPI